MLLQLLWLLFGIVGVMSAADWVLSAVLTPHGTRCVWLLAVEPGTQNVEQLLRWSWEALRWSVWLRRGELVVVDCGADAQQRRIIEAFSARRTGIRIVDPEEAGRIGDPKVCKSVQIVLY